MSASYRQHQLTGLQSAQDDTATAHDEELTFQEANGGISGQAECLHGLDNVHQPLEVAGHVIPTLGADVLQGVGGDR